MVMAISSSDEPVGIQPEPPILTEIQSIYIDILKEITNET